jgi:hypothetical protein
MRGIRSSRKEKVFYQDCPDAQRTLPKSTSTMSFNKEFQHEIREGNRGGLGLFKWDGKTHQPSGHVVVELMFVALDIKGDKVCLHRQAWHVLRGTQH